MRELRGYAFLWEREDWCCVNGVTSVCLAVSLSSYRNWRMFLFRSLSMSCDVGPVVNTEVITLCKAALSRCCYRQLVTQRGRVCEVSAFHSFLCKLMAGSDSCYVRYVVDLVAWIQSRTYCPPRIRTLLGYQDAPTVETEALSALEESQIRRLKSSSRTQSAGVLEVFRFSSKDSCSQYFSLE